MASRDKKLPTHVAIIMDGNGRWARRKGLTTGRGHREGAEAVRRVVEVCADKKIRYLTLYAFSTENWSRSDGEIKTLMGLLKRFLGDKVTDMNKHGIRLNAVGDLAGLPRDVQAALGRAVAQTGGNTEGVLTLALNYGSRQELVHAAQSLAESVERGQVSVDQIDEQLFASRLYTAGLPDPDLLIRTSGELRLSNFLLWQLSYAEFWFTDTLWPDFGKEEFQRALDEFAQRKRRYGGRKGRNRQ